jgi:hypothetical protein
MSRLCQGCSHPPRHLPDKAALSCTALLRQNGDEGLPPPFELSAPHGARGSRLSQTEAELYLEWIANDRQLRAIITQMRQVAVKATELTMKEAKNKSTKV